MDNTSIIINNEEFKQIKINPNYYINSNGKIYSKFSKKILKEQIQKFKGKEYKRVDINVNGKQKHFMIHKLVFETWVRTLKDGEQVNHIDDNTYNNHYSNLYAGSQKENIKDCISNNHRVGNMFYLTIFDKEKNIIKTFCPAKDFIDYCGHPNKSGSLNKFFNKNWFKKRYEIIEFRKVNNLEEYRSVTTMADECKPVK